jgi:hypothetical protein
MPQPGSLLFAINADVALPAFGFVTVVYLVLACLVLRMRALDLKLMVLGMLTAVVAAWCGLLTSGDGMSIQGRMGPPGQIGMALGHAEAAAIFARIAVLLLLGGFACMVLTRWPGPAAPVSPERDTP